MAHYSADVWSHRSLFKLDDAGNPTVVAGVPPDYFSTTGQLWGNPLYRWPEMAKDDYRWWRERFASLLGLADLIRVDHFRGFEACWEVPAAHTTAEKGRWVKVPGNRLFSVLKRYFGHLPVIAEDLGVITPPVTALRQKFSFPGMKVLHFLFRQDGQGQAEPLGCPQDAVIYTGTHDNNTTVGWYQELKAAGDTASVDQYLNMTATTGEGEVAWRLMELAYQSKAATAIVPLQDVLGLGAPARMNTPGTVGGNWLWRSSTCTLTGELASRLAALVAKYHRGRTAGK